MAVIEFAALTKRFGETVAVDDLSFDVEAGQVVGFLGPNGAGKTTSLYMLLGLVSPTAGRASVNGRLFKDLDEPLHAIGALVEAAGAHPGRTARNHLLSLAMLGRAGSSRVGQVLELVDLGRAADKRVGTFSLGMRQRLGLATALLCDPEILVLDEPANGLDPEGVHWLRQLLRQLAREGRTVLVSSHLLGEVAQTVDRVVIMAQGRLVANTTLDELTRLGGGPLGDTRSLEDAFLALTAPGATAGTGSDGNPATTGKGVLTPLGAVPWGVKKWRS
ncbi:MAG TPA: ATP-binding cassette domain-containing protein [Acidimicrobiales bacterium]|nr:ATP-binding cassette domain-containing protein [Acidimicrobiales bacterium]